MNTAMNHILACTDGSIYSPSILDHAAWAARRCGVPVRVLHMLDPHRERAEVVDISGAMGVDAGAAFLAELAELEEKKNRLAMERGKVLLAEAARRLGEAGVERVTTVMEHGELVEAVTSMEREADLVVVGKRGESADFAKLHLGSNLERVVRGSIRPVLVASREFRPIGSFVIAYDGGASIEKAVRFACGSGLLKGLGCRLVHAGREGDRGAAAMGGAVEALRAAGFDAAGECIEGHPEEVVSDALVRHGAGLLVTGAYGHSRLRQLVIGSTTAVLLRTCRVPVLMFR
jgi:nucleotide-binding universal stress UspA family protein